MQGYSLQTRDRVFKLAEALSPDWNYKTRKIAEVIFLLANRGVINLNRATTANDIIKIEAALEEYL